MRRRSFLGLLAGASLAVMAARTGLAPPELPPVPEFKAIDSPWMTDSNAWFIKIDKQDAKRFAWFVRQSNPGGFFP